MMIFTTSLVFMGLLFNHTQLPPLVIGIASLVLYLVLSWYFGALRTVLRREVGFNPTGGYVVCLYLVGSKMSVYSTTTIGGVKETVKKDNGFIIASFRTNAPSSALTTLNNMLAGKSAWKASGMLLVLASNINDPSVNRYIKN